MACHAITDLFLNVPLGLYLLFGFIHSRKSLLLLLAATIVVTVLILLLIKLLFRISKA